MVFVILEYLSSESWTSLTQLSILLPKDIIAYSEKKSSLNKKLTLINLSNEVVQKTHNHNTIGKTSEWNSKVFFNLGSMTLRFCLFIGFIFIF